MYGLMENKSNLIIKISKGQSEAVHGSMTNNAMTKKIQDKKTNIDLQTTLLKTTLQRRYLISAHVDI